MNAYRKLIQNTFLYGLSTVVPRMISVVLLPLYTGVLENASFGDYSILFVYFGIFNVILAYGMETGFFRFYESETDKQKVIHTSTWSIIVTTLLFLVVAWLNVSTIAQWIGFDVLLVKLMIGILVLDALAVIPFAWLRATNKSGRFAVIKIINVSVNLLLNVFLLIYLSDLAEQSSFFESFYISDFEVSYIFISNFIASLVTLLLLGDYLSKIRFQFDWELWKRIIRYSYPVLIAGMAYTVNELVDRLLLDFMLEESTSRAQVGIYSACYKLGMFMTLFATAFRLGIEPFFFSHAKTQNPQKGYALITKYFAIIGSFILLVVVVFADILKLFLIRDESFWEGMQVVPLILLANLCLGIYHNLSVWYKVTDRTKIGAYISSFGAFLTILTNIWLIPILGYVGSAIATVCAYASMMLISYVVGQRYYPIPYRIGRISTYMLLSIGLGGIYFYLFRENYWVGISFIILFSSLMVFNEKNEIKSLYSKKQNK